MDNTSLRNTVIASSIIIIGLFSRLLPHMPNFSPMESMALLGGAYISKRYLAFLLPIVVMYISDFVLNNTLLRVYYPDHEGLVFFGDYMLTVIPAMLLIVLLGQTFLKKLNPGKIIITALGGSILFFLITNFGSWIGPLSPYPKTFSGLIAAFVAGIPFFKSSVLSTLFFTMASFGAVEFISAYFAKKNILAKG